jgi:hypothetical protein
MLQSAIDFLKQKVEEHPGSMLFISPLDFVQFIFPNGAYFKITKFHEMKYLRFHGDTSHIKPVWIYETAELDYFFDEFLTLRKKYQKPKPKPRAVFKISLEVIEE